MRFTNRLLLPLLLLLQNDVLSVVVQNGVLSGAPYLFMWMFLVVSGMIADVLRNKNVLSTTNIRKMMNAIGQSRLIIMSL